MDEHQVIDALKACIYLLGAWCFLMLHGKTRREQFRYEMQWLGEDLDEEACAEGSDLNPASYGLLRKTVNGFIGAGDKLTPSHVLVAAVFGRRRGEYFTKKWEQATRDLSPAAHARLEWFRREIYRQVVSHIFIRSPVFIATAILPFLNWLKEGWVRDWLIKKLRQPLDNLVLDALAQGEAYSHGQPHNQAHDFKGLAG